MGHKPRKRILDSSRHPRRVVDPLGLLDCQCDTVVVHTTSGKSLGDDVVECPTCGVRVTLREMFAVLGGSPPV